MNEVEALFWLFLALFTEQSPPQTERHTRLWNSPLARYAVSPFVRAG